jgi:hypothetical protein
VRYTSRTVTVTAHTENLPEGDLEAYVYASATDEPFPGGSTTYDAAFVQVTGGVVSAREWHQTAGHFEATPTDRVTYTRTGPNLTIVADAAFLSFTGPGYFSVEIVSGTSNLRAPDGAGRVGYGPVSPAAIATSTALSLSSGTQKAGRAGVTATATVSPASAGVVTFLLDGVSPIAILPVVGGVATATVSPISKPGDHTVTAVFTPTDAVDAAASSSAPVAFAVVPQNTTNTSAKLSKRSQKLGGPASRLTIRVSKKAPGKVIVYDGKKKLRTITLKKGKASYTLSKKLKKGTHRLRVEFRPSNPGKYGPSRSKTVKLTVTR